MKTRTLILIIITAACWLPNAAQAQSMAADTCPPIDSLAVIQKYLADHRGELPQNTVIHLGQTERHKYKTGIFLGGGVGVRNFQTHMDVKKNGQTTIVWKPASEILMFYVSGQIVHGKNIFGMNLGNTTVSWSYTRHIN